MLVRTYSTPDEAYRSLLSFLIGSPDYVCKPRGMVIREITGSQVCIENPSSNPIVTSDEDRNVKIAEYTAKELDLYLSGTNLASVFETASKFWGKIANPDGTINSAYGYLIWHDASCKSRFSDQAVTPWQWARDSLVVDRDSRQAILYFNQPHHAWTGNKDFPCTMFAQFLIRNNELDMFVSMRSNDIFKGTVYDWPFFMKCQELMLGELRNVYPGLKLGRYHHSATSLHMYESDLHLALKMLGRVQ